MSAAGSVGPFMDALEARDVRFGLRDGRLTLDAPRGVLTEDVRNEIVARKGEVERLVRAGCEPSPAPPPARRKEPRPATRCYCCGTLTWWERATGGWVCGVCHPLAPRPSFSLDHLSAAGHRDRTRREGADERRGWEARDVSAGGRAEGGDEIASVVP